MKTFALVVGGRDRAVKGKKGKAIPVAGHEGP
jgi:hypothetical protein